MSMCEITAHSIFFKKKLKNDEEYTRKGFAKK